MKYISIPEYARRRKTLAGNIYYWIKTGKIKAEDLKIENVKRIKVREDAEPLIKHY